MMKIDLRRINIYCAGSKGWIFNAYIISAEHTVGRFVQCAHTIIMLMPLFNRRSTRRPHYNFIACTWGRKQRKTHATCNLSSAPFIFGAKCTHLRVWITTTAGIYANKFLLLSHSRQMTLRCGNLSERNLLLAQRWCICALKMTIATVGGWVADCVFCCCRCKILKVCRVSFWPHGRCRQLFPYRPFSLSQTE